MRAEWQVFLNVNLLTHLSYSNIPIFPFPGYFPPFLLLLLPLSPLCALINTTKRIKQMYNFEYMQCLLKWNRHSLFLLLWVTFLLVRNSANQTSKEKWIGRYSHVNCTCWTVMQSYPWEGEIRHPVEGSGKIGMKLKQLVYPVYESIQTLPLYCQHL